MERLHARLGAAEALLAAAFLTLMTVLIFAAGVARLAGHPINWAVDAATALFAWAVFLCADVAWRHNALMTIDVLVRRLPPGMRKACRLFNYFVIAAFLVYAIGMGLWLSWISRARSFQGIPEVSYSWITLSMPVGAALLLFTTVLKIRAALREV